ncbi:MAG: hypothetical protein ACSHYF_03340 [Verrucomicrobiaceae bacterium]
MNAAVIAGTGSGMGLSVEVAVGGVTGITVGPEAQIQVTSPGPDSLNASVLAVNETVTMLGSVGAQNGVDNAIVGSAFSDVTGVGTTGNSSGSSTVHQLGITLVPGVALTPDFLSLSSTAISSTTSSTGQFGALSSTGSVVLTDLVIVVDGVTLALASNPPPNTIVDLAASGITDTDILANLTIILNEQVATGDGLESTGLTTNALRISLGAIDLGLPGGNVVSEIIAGQSSSSMSAVPEPSVFALLAFFPGMMLLRRR